MSRLQLALNVPDIDEAVDFYSALFATTPHKRRPGYANFAIADPPLKLVLFESAEATPGSINHLGIEVEEGAAVEQAHARLVDSGLVNLPESATECCFAVQDKVWTEDPWGGRWEVYTVTDDDPDGLGLEAGDQGPGVACCS